MDILALLLVLLAAVLYAPPVSPRARAWALTILLVAVVCQLTTITDHPVDL